MVTARRRRTRRALLAVAASFIAAEVVVFIAGRDRMLKIADRPTSRDSSAALSIPGIGFQSSPSGDDSSKQGSAAAPGTTAGTLTGVRVEEIQTEPTGGKEAETPAGLQTWPDVTNRISDRSGGRVAVYVYEDIPELDHSDLVECYQENSRVAPWQDEQADMAQDMGEIWLHRSVLAHPWRVFDPEEADIFFVPIYPILSIKLALAGERPWASRKPVDMDEHRCRGLTHYNRMTTAVKYLIRSSLFFNRFGGADHVVICAWWNCRTALDPTHRMLLRRTVVGINERLVGWTRWGCGSDRTLTVPYTASSVLTTSDKIGGLPASDRDITFFFVGTERSRQERTNLDVVMNISETSLILLGGDEENWGMNSTEYAAHMSRSRFCFCPQGDTESSRRIFDALAAGCIPIVTETGVAVLPFVEVGLNYSEFAVVVDEFAFSTREAVQNVARDILARSEEEWDKLRRGMKKGARTILYGITRGPGLKDMRPFLDTATKFLQAAHVLTGGGNQEKEEVGRSTLWSCPNTNVPEDKLALRSSISLPPSEHLSRQWLTETETIVNKERSLLFCAPPNTGSLQFRMLAKRMQGISHWSVHDDRSLLFDREASGLELLDVRNRNLLTAIYRANGSGWIKIGVVRDPVTRLLSAYLSLVKTWRAGLRQSREAKDDADTPREHQHHQHEGLDMARRRLKEVRVEEPLPGAGTKSEWELYDAIVDKRAGTKSEWELYDAIVDKRRGRRQRRRRRRPSQLQQQQEVEGEADAVEGEGFHQGKGRGGGGAWGGGGEEVGREGATAEAHRHDGFRPDHRSRRQYQSQRRPQRRRMTVLKRGTKSGGRLEGGGQQGQAFWEGPGGWDGPAGAATAAGRSTGFGESVGGTGSGVSAAGDVGGGGGVDGSAEIDIPTFSEVLDALKHGMRNAPVAFRPAVSLCGQRASPFDSIIPFERLQKTSTEVLKSLPGGVWEAFGASGWGPDGEHAFMEFDYGEAASAWRTNSSGRSGGGDNGSISSGSNSTVNGSTSSDRNRKSAGVNGRGRGRRRLTGEPERDPKSKAVVDADGGVNETKVDATRAPRRLAAAARVGGEKRGVNGNGGHIAPVPLRARDLFNGEDPCAWVAFYDSLETLEKVGRLYEMDYKYYRWYRLDPWRKSLQACLHH